MTPEAARALRNHDVATPVADEQAFTDEYPADDLVVSHLWELLEDTETVLFRIPERLFRVFCGDDAPTGPETAAVVAEVERVRTRDGDTVFVVSGAAARETHQLLARRDRLRQRRAEVEAGEREEDATELQQAADALDCRARVRDDLDSSFTTRGIPAHAIAAAYYHGEERDRRRWGAHAKLGV